MYEVDFLPVGQAGKHGDAIAMRFTRPDTGGLAHVVIDAGFIENGDALVEHVQRWYGRSSIDLAILTHPDGDHIGGMGIVLRELSVGELWVHRLGRRGGAGLPAARAVDELIAVADQRGTAIHEPFAGVAAFGGALRILGPTEHWYGELVAEQRAEASERGASLAGSLGDAAQWVIQRFLPGLGPEVPFDDAGGTNPRNNTSAVILIEIGEHRMLFTADAGVPALDRAWDWLELNDGDARAPDFVQLPHHGSRHNASSTSLNRILGPTGQPQVKTAFVNVGPGAKKHPSPRVANGFMRRGFRVYQTKGRGILHHGDGAPNRGWAPVDPLEPLDESQED